MLPLHAAELDEHRVESLDYGRALYHFFQENELNAITRLMIAQERPITKTQLDEANLLLADLYYSYGLYEESREMFARLLNAEVSEAIQDRIWFNLARLRFEQGFPEHARDLLSRISTKLPKNIEAERKYLLTNLFLIDGQYGPAIRMSSSIDSESIWKIYARYNVAVSMIEEDDEKRYEQGSEMLEKLGLMEPTSAEMVALRDRANLSLGLKQLRMELPDSALESLSRVRLEGPLSNDALLASGWAWYRLEKFEQAQKPWRALLQRNAVDAATQEAILAIPANYATAGRDDLAIRYYEVAAKQFDAQLGLLDSAVGSIESDGLIAALREHAILYDRSSLQRLPPSSDVTPQLHLLLASKEFQRELKRYQDLLDIRQSLRYWGNSFPALELMLEERRQTFTQKLPKLQQSTSFDRLEDLLVQRDEYAARLQEIEASEDYAALATPEQQENLERLVRVGETMEKAGAIEDMSDQRDMLRVLSGLLHYELATDYPAMLWRAKKQLIGLDRALDEAEARVEGLLRISERTELEFSVFDGRIGGQVDRIKGMRQQVANLLQQQEQKINQMAIDAIRAQQKHIVQLRLNARFELAKIYDKLAANDEQ